MLFRHLTHYDTEAVEDEDEVEGYVVVLLRHNLERMC